MKKIIISKMVIITICLMFISTLNTFALSYTITFTGSGASTTVENVIVQNLTKGTTVTVPTGNVLNLSDIITSVDELNTLNEGINIYPNPIKESSLISFYTKNKGLTNISAYTMDGRKIIGLNINLPEGYNSFKISLPYGVYLIKIDGNGYSYNAKVYAISVAKTTPEISINSLQSNFKSQKNKSAVTSMFYNSGDQLLYKGISGNYTTIVTDVPTTTKTINFEFVECKDGDGNNYSVVKIGTQTWMAENLRTTKFNDLSDISYSTDLNLNSAAYCWYNNDITNKVNSTLYNWHSASSTKIAPIGWHVPTDSDWETLRTLLGGYFDAGGKLKESGTTHWASPNTEATNETGFTALPTGRQLGQDSFDGAGLTHFWSSSYFGMYAGQQSSRTYVISQNNTLFADYIYSINCRFSIRCIKD